MENVALVTGASSGIGRETALKLAGAGYKVYGAARHTENIPDGIQNIFMDVTDGNSIEEGVKTILADEGRIDILVNDAGYGFYGTIEDVPLEEARREMEVNLFSIAHLCQLVLPGMRRRGFGKIVNISSIAGKMTTPLGGWYHASKFALEGLSDTLRQEVEPFGIDVIIIEPGIIDTPWWEKARRNLDSVSGDSAYADRIRQWRTVPEMDVNADKPELGRHLTPDDPRNYNLKKHMVRLALYELTKLIAPNNVSVVRLRDYEDSKHWLLDASKLRLDPKIPRKLAEDNKPVMDWQLATFQNDYDPYKNPWLT